jgi:hypothetical protein
MGGVFINYRTVDDPLGAALIHDRLASRFGRDNVFRDCVSLTPGAHYPSAIRSALENSAVLVAVIGPRWLTLTDGDAVRLIDRDTDWVRTELVVAFGSGIPVLPVLLKDTPDNATMPTMDELPADIRPLATLQAVEISQRRLGDDLDRLVAAVARIGPVPTPSGSVLPRSQDTFFAMVDVLETVPSLNNEHDRATLINKLRPAIGSSVRYSARRRTHVINLLDACRAYPGGIAELLEIIRHLDGESLALRNLAELAATMSDGVGLQP